MGISIQILNNSKVGGNRLALLYTYGTPLVLSAHLRATAAHGFVSSLLSAGFVASRFAILLTLPTVCHRDHFSLVSECYIHSTAPAGTTVRIALLSPLTLLSPLALLSLAPHAFTLLEGLRVYFSQLSADAPCRVWINLFAVSAQLLVTTLPLPAILLSVTLLAGHLALALLALASALLTPLISALLGTLSAS